MHESVAELPMSMAISLGKIEERLASMAGLDDRLRNVENTLERLQASQRPRTPWWQVVTAVTALVVAVGAFITAVVTIATLTAR